MSRNGEFTVNIALVEDGKPTLGVVLAPALGRAFCGVRGVGAFAEEHGQRRAIACRRPPAKGLTVVSSRSHGDREALEDFLVGRRVESFAYAGSSLKFVWSRLARLTSIRAWAGRWNGTLRPVTRCSPRPGAVSRGSTAARNSRTASRSSPTPTSSPRG